MVRLTMPRIRAGTSGSGTNYRLEETYLKRETPRLYGESAQCLADAARYWGLITNPKEHEFDHGVHREHAATAWEKASEGLAYMTMARQCHRYLREHTDEVHVPEGMRVYPRALFQQMLKSMLIVHSRTPVPTPQNAATLRGMARNLAEQTHAVAVLLGRGNYAVEPLPPVE